LIVIIINAHPSAEAPITRIGTALTKN
jgi:hypothetical protein